MILRLKNITIIVAVILVLFAFSIPALMMVNSDMKTMIMASAESEFDDISQFSALFIYLSSG